MRALFSRSGWLCVPAAFLLLAAGAGIDRGRPADAANKVMRDGFAIMHPRMKLPFRVRGKNAVNLLGNRLGEVAARYGESGQQLARTLQQDNDLWMDTSSRLVYACEGLKRPKNAKKAVQRAAGSSVQAPPFPLSETFELHSLEDSKHKIYLDFNGHVVSGTPWNTSGDITALAFSLDADRTTFNDQEREVIQNMFLRVKEDFSPFDVDVTTEEPGAEFLSRTSASDDTYGMRVLITPTNDVAPTAGGVAFLGSFIGDQDITCWVFSDAQGNDEQVMAETVSHEVGHTVGLNHDGQTGGVEYYPGHGNWGPIMGAPFGIEITQWSRGEYANASNTEDDFVVMTQTGLPFLPDDAGNTVQGSEELEGIQPVISGIISSASDIDVYEFFSGAGTISLDFAAGARSPNADLQLTLYDANGNLVTVTNPPGLPAAINRSISGGTFYVAVQGVGTGNVNTGYSAYGSVGQYTLSADLIRSFRLIQPTAGSAVILDQPTEIQWSSEGLQLPSNVKIEFSPDGGTTWETIVASTPNSLFGSFEWTPEGDPTDTARIRLTLVEQPSISVTSGNFRLLRGAVEVTNPNGGEVLVRGKRATLRWDATDFAETIARVKIELSRNAGESWDVLFSSTPNDGQQDWAITGPETEEALIRVTTVNPGVFTDTSDAEFSIREPSTITITAPNGPGVLAAGKPVNVTWNSTGFKGNVRIELTRNAGSEWEELFPNIENNGEVTWVASGPATRSARLRITSIEEPGVTDSSNGLLEIVVPSINVTSPAKGAKGLIGTQLDVRWTSAGVAGAANVRVDLSRDGGASWTPALASTINDGAAAIEVTGPASSNALVRVVALDGSQAQGLSTSFPVAAPTLFVVSPSGGTKLKIGSQTLIEWTGTTLGNGTVDIFLSKDGGATFPATPIVENAENDGAESWGVRGPANKNAVIKIVWRPLRTVSGNSAGRFQIIKKKKGRR